MAEKKRIDHFDRPGGYAMPKGSVHVNREAAGLFQQSGSESLISMLGDTAPRHEPAIIEPADLKPVYQLDDPQTQVYLGDCRDVLPALAARDGKKVDLIFADPPFNWDVPYDEWRDGMPRAEYERFTFDWLDACLGILSTTGSLWVNIPDDTAAEVVLHLKRRGLSMMSWCVWHFRFGQHRDSTFIMSKVHALYFVQEPLERTWNPDSILEQSDRAAIYNDKRTHAKDRNAGKRVPLDVWYGKNWGRIQGNNMERRKQHHNQIPEVYLERVIRSCSNEGDLVLDPFLGSGTTGTVARALKRRSIGIEYGKKNAESAFERIKSGPVHLVGDACLSTAIFAKRAPKTTRKKRRTSSSKQGYGSAAGGTTMAR